MSNLKKKVKPLEEPKRFLKKHPEINDDLEKLTILQIEFEGILKSFSILISTSSL